MQSSSKSIYSFSFLFSSNNLTSLMFVFFPFFPQKLRIATSDLPRNSRLRSLRQTELPVGSSQETYSLASNSYLLIFMQSRTNHHNELIQLNSQSFLVTINEHFISSLFLSIYLTNAVYVSYQYKLWASRALLSHMELLTRDKSHTDRRKKNEATIISRDG